MFCAIQDTRIFMMMVMRACSWPKKPTVPYKQNMQSRTKAILKVLILVINQLNAQNLVLL